MKVKFTEWEGSKIREMDVADGATYHCGTENCVFLAVPNRRSVCVIWEGKPDNDLSAYVRGSAPVTILDWPDHCGPRPDAERPTYEQAVKNAPSKDAYVVFCHSGGGKEFIKASAFSCEGTSRTVGRVLGYLEFPED